VEVAELAQRHSEGRASAAASDARVASDKAADAESLRAEVTLMLVRVLWLSFFRWF